MSMPSPDGALRGAPRVAARFLIVLLLLLVGALAPSPAAAQTGSISGFVVDTFGNRISNATVLAVTGPSAPRQVRTAADGSYLISRLNPGRYTFAAERTGFETDVRNFNVISGTSSRVDFSLRSEIAQGGVLQGTVLRRGSTEPVSGASVQLTGGAGFPNQNTTTDSSGGYRFSNLPSGRVRIAVSRSGFLDEARQVTLTEGRVRTENFSLRLRTADLARLTGVVTDESNVPIRNARVTLADGASEGLSDTTDSRGRYSITRIVPDVYSVVVTAPDFITGGRDNVVLNAGASVVLNVTLTETGAADASIDGLVVDTLGNPLQGARVVVTSGPLPGRSDVTDVQGAYLLDNLVAGNYGLRVTATGFESQNRLVTVASGAALRIDFVLRENVVVGNGTIAGTITRSDTTPIVGATVRTTNGPVVGASTTSDADGDYSLDNLPEGTYTILVSRSGFTSQTISAIEVDPGQTTTVDVVLGATGGDGGTLTGLVTSSDAVPLSGVTLRAFLDDDLVATTSTNSTGRYTFTDLDAGSYTIRASRSGFVTLEIENVRVDAGAATQLDLELIATDTGTGIIAGSVLDPSGRAVQNALVELTGPSDARTARTDAEGNFEFTNLPAGVGYSVTVTASGLNPATRSNLELEAEQRLNLRFNLTREVDGGGSIAGMVRAPNGQRLPGATVTIVGGPSVGDSRTTASNGQFNFTGLPGGVYTLQITASGFRPARTSVYVRPANGAFVIVTMRR
ncbi:MAG: carboxypeptidase regulatory-like domain-containing protein [Actinomycetota bacterium]